MNQTPKKRSARPGRFDGTEAAPLDLRTAARWTAAERRQNPDQPRAYFFGRDIIEKILAQPDCKGLRVYYALNPNPRNRQRHLLIVGADAEQNDQLPPLQPRQIVPAEPAEPAGADAPAPDSNKQSFEAIIAEMAIPCPNQCGSPNLLNGYGKS